MSERLTYLVPNVAKLLDLMNDLHGKTDEFYVRVVKGHVDLRVFRSGAGWRCVDVDGLRIPGYIGKKRFMGE